MAKEKRTIYTVGYEGRTVEAFLSKLLDAGVKRVLDVRCNPVSRKIDFSKRRLQELCEKAGLDYVHLAALGVPAGLRRDLATWKDYQKLLGYYEKTLLPRANGAKRQAVTLIKDQPTALLCYEADSKWCHRGRLAKAISHQTGMTVVNL